MSLRPLPPQLEQLLEAASSLKAPSGRQMLSPSMLGTMRALAGFALAHPIESLSSDKVVTELVSMGIKIAPPTFEERTDGRKGRHRTDGGFLKTVQRRFAERTGVRLRDAGRWQLVPALARIAELCVEQGSLRQPPRLELFFGSNRSPQTPRRDHYRSPDMPPTQIREHRSVLSTKQDTTPHMGRGGGTPPPAPPSAYSSSPGGAESGVGGSEYRRRSARPAELGRTLKGRKHLAQELSGDALEAYQELLSIPDFRPARALDIVLQRSLSTVRYAIRTSQRSSTRDTARLVSWLLAYVLTIDESVETDDESELRDWSAAEAAMRVTRGDRRRARGATWRQVVEEMRASSILLQRTGESQWNELVASSQYLGSSRFDYVQVRTREARDLLAESYEDIDIACRRIGETFTPKFVVRAERTKNAPAIEAEPLVDLGQELDAVDESRRDQCQMLVSMGIGLAKAIEAVHSHDSWRLWMLIAQARRRQGAGEEIKLQSAGSWIVGTLDAMKAMSFDEQIAFEVLLENGMWSKPARSFAKQEPMGRICEVVDRALEAASRSGQARVGGYIRDALTVPYVWRDDVRKAAAERRAGLRLELRRRQMAGEDFDLEQAEAEGFKAPIASLDRLVAAAPLPEEYDKATVSQLQQLNMELADAVRTVTSYPLELVRHNVEVILWRKRYSKARITNPPGLLISALKKGETLRGQRLVIDWEPTVAEALPPSASPEWQTFVTACDRTEPELRQRCEARWKETLGILRGRLAPAMFGTWIRQLIYLGSDSTRDFVAAPNAPFVTGVQECVWPELEQAAAQAGLRIQLVAPGLLPREIAPVDVVVRAEDSVDDAPLVERAPRYDNAEPLASSEAPEVAEVVAEGKPTPVAAAEGAMSSAEPAGPPLPPSLEALRSGTTDADRQVDRRRYHEVWWRLRGAVDESEYWLVDPLRSSYVGSREGHTYVYFRGMFGLTAATRFRNELVRFSRGVGMRLVIVCDTEKGLKEVQAS